MFVGSLLWEERNVIPRFMQGLGSIIVADLPTNDPAYYERELKVRAKRLDAAISVWDVQGKPIARTGDGRLLSEGTSGASAGPTTSSEHTVWIALDDGGTMALKILHPRASRYFRISLVVLFGAILLGSHFAARRITRRLKVLEEGVTKFGHGDLEARVTLPGGDEIARLADAFNNSSTRIAGLVTQQRRLLQSASHELRSPLARLAMALELLCEPEPIAPASANVCGQMQSATSRTSDQLIGDLLLSGRLADSRLPKDFVPVSLAPLLREEAVRVGAAFELADSNEVYSVPGNPRMLRSLIRNLLENARRHGQTPIRTALRRDAQGELVLTVDDSGAGVAEAEREKIFEPFYRPKGHRETQDGGVGLGLFLVKSLVEHHGGQVRYVAMPQGSGSRSDSLLEAPDGSYLESHSVGSGMMFQVQVSRGLSRFKMVSRTGLPSFHT